MVSAFFDGCVPGLSAMAVCHGKNCSLNLLDLPAESGHLRVGKIRDMVSGTFEGRIKDGLQSR